VDPRLSQLEIADASGKDPFGVAGDLPVLPDVDAVIETGIDYCVLPIEPMPTMPARRFAIRHLLSRRY
jgi:hypothetical protein